MLDITDMIDPFSDISASLSDESAFPSETEEEKSGPACPFASWETRLLPELVREIFDLEIPASRA